MDQSNGGFSDQQLRASSIQWAIQASAATQAHPGETILDARAFYLLLAGRDPIVDGDGPVSEKPTAQIINFPTGISEDDLAGIGSANE